MSRAFFFVTFIGVIKELEPGDGDGVGVCSTGVKEEKSFVLEALFVVNEATVDGINNAGFLSNVLFVDISLAVSEADLNASLSPFMTLDGMLYSW